MDSNIVIIILLVSILCIICTIPSIFIIKPLIEKYLDIKSINNENEKIKLFMKIDPKLIETEIDELIKKYLDNYVLENIIIKNIDYIKQKEVDKMIKSLDKEIILDISELYIFYIKTLRNINDENDLLIYIDHKVKEQVLSFVTSYNTEK